AVIAAKLRRPVDADGGIQEVAVAERIIGAGKYAEQARLVEIAVRAGILGVPFGKADAAEAVVRKADGFKRTFVDPLGADVGAAHEVDAVVAGLPDVIDAYVAVPICFVDIGTVIRALFVGAVRLVVEELVGQRRAVVAVLVQPPGEAE